MLLKVVDASVAVKWFIAEEDSAKAIILRDNHGKGAEILIAPDIILPEIANALSFSHIFTALEIKSCMESIYEAEIDFIEPSCDIIVLAIDLIFRHKITIYDALYLSLAEIFDIPFITADKKLHTAVKSSFINIKLLSEI